jgi:aminopeptidase N
MSIALALAGMLCFAPAAHAAATGLGDPFFPKSGNPGYDVADYNLSLNYQPHKNLLRATDTITATATEGLVEYSLDLYKLKATAVSVDGVPVAFRQSPSKLNITPPALISAGQQFTTVVSYRGRPGPIQDPDGSFEGWFRTGDGAVAFGEPLGTATWAACNNTLVDKATWSVEINVPANLHGVASGQLTGVRRNGARKLFNWRESQPMTPYLAALDIGRGAVKRSSSAGIPTWTAVDPRVSRATRRVLRKLPAVIRFEQRIFGPYPFDSAGSIVDPATVGYALESQTRPTYSFDTDLITVVHETAHQWFGDSVGLSRWPDIWLNEGFADWSELYWSERHGGLSAKQALRRYRRQSRTRRKLWAPPPGRPGDAKYLFAQSVYLRGGMALEALREKVGTPTFFDILQTWTAQNRYGTAKTNQFIALAESISGKDLGPLFQRWLFKRGNPTRGKPARPLQGFQQWPAVPMAESRPRRVEVRSCTPQLEQCVAVIEQDLPDLGVEVGAESVADHGQRRIHAQGGAVGAVAEQSVEDVRDRDDPALERNLITGKAQRIAVAVPALVMGQRD